MPSAPAPGKPTVTPVTYAYYAVPSGPYDLTPRGVEDSRTDISRIMTQQDANLHGNIHGGAILHLVDELGGAVAARHCRGQAVTVSLDSFSFLAPVRVGDLVRAVAQVNWTGRSSVEVGVRVEAERWDEIVQPRHVASAYFVYVALDEHGNPRQVPPVVCTAAVDVRRNAEAQIRQQARQYRRAQITALRDRT